MLAENASRICVFAAINFDLVPMLRVHNAVEAIFDRLEPNWMAAHPFYYLFRSPEQNWLLNIGVQRIAWTMLDFSQWKANLSEYMTILNVAIEKMAIKKFNKIGFKVLSYIPLGMTRVEMSRLMFGSFLAERNDLIPILDEIDDPSVQFHGKREDLNCSVNLTAMNKEDILGSVRSIPDMTHLRDDAFSDSKLKRFYDLVSSEECFYFDVDFSRSDLPASELTKFFSTSLVEAESLATACVNYLRSKPVKK